VGELWVVYDFGLCVEVMCDKGFVLLLVQSMFLVEFVLVFEVVCIVVVLGWVWIVEDDMLLCEGIDFGCIFDDFVD